MYTVIDGTLNAIGSDTGGTMTNGTSYVLICTADGNVQECYRDGDPIFSTSESFNNTATRVGMWHHDTNTGRAYDNFAVWPIGNGGEYNVLDNY
jgi:hypothetical protein